ncbi:hypothetical protein [Nonomuraea fuscirosea]
MKRLEQAEEMARDLVVTVLDADLSETGAKFELTASGEGVITRSAASFRT